MSVKKLVKGILAGLIMAACSVSKSTDDATLFSQDEESYKKQIKEFEFSLKPFTSGKMAAINYGKRINDIPKTNLDSILNEYDHYACFLFEVDIEGFKGEIADYDLPGREVDYNKKLNYYLFDMQRDLKLINDKGEEFPCVLYYHERMNEVIKSNRFLIGFEKPKSGNVYFEYNNPLINCGKIKINIEKQHLASK